ncbi:DNRLRE domain-containing protein [Streptomyces sp. NPDC090088]|uniref:DNRLRE domain-containing protein n=1 Tax=Streptomyces sp. NPDC090088 TaxID=3365944 RepID=UPI00380EF76E
MNKRDRAVPGAPGLRRGYRRGNRRGALAAGSALLLAGLVMSTAPAGQQRWSGTAGGGRSASVPVTTLDDTSGQAAAKALSFLSEDELARRQAKLSGERVELASERTETSTTYVNPDGTLTTESYAGPVRVKDENGSWQDIDTELSDEGPALEPEAAAADITVSDGGDKRLASVAEGSASLALGWEDTLPTPKVTGDTAAYDLGEGQTLTVTALKEGFSQNVVLDEAPDGDLTYRIPVTLRGLTLSEADSGHLLLRNTAGDLVAEAPAPMMWDSSKDAVSGESQHLASVDTDIETAADGTQTLVLHPDADYFAQDLTYPVTVDPTSTLAVTTDTWVATNYTDSQISSTELKSGTYNGGDTVARSYLKFDVSDFVGTHITDTNLALYSYWSSSCTGGTGTAVRRITESWSSSDITWSTKPAGTTTGQVINTAAKGYSSACPAGTMNFDIDDIVQAWANGTANYGLMIRGLDETDSYTWRRFRSANYVSGDGSTEPHLTVTYNSYPKTPGSLTLAPSTTSGSEKVVTSLTPVFSAKVGDVDSGAKVRVQYAVEPDPDYADTTYTLTQSSGYVSSGKSTALTVPSSTPLKDGTHLRIRARAYDGTDYSTAWTSWQTFTVDTGALDIPDVPTDLQTGATETTTPLLTAMVTTLDRDALTAEYVLYDSSSAVVGENPLGVAAVDAGERAALQVPETLTDGATYSWKARACNGAVCSSYSPKQSFTVDVTSDDGGSDGTDPEAAVTTVPSAVTDLTVTAGAESALITWNGDFSSDESNVTTYGVTATTNSGVKAATATTTGNSAVITGLTDNTPYTFTVAGTNTYGTGASVTSAAATPKAVTGGKQVYFDAVQQYLESGQNLLTGDSVNAATASSDATYGSGFEDALTEEQDSFLEERAVLADEGFDNYASTVELADPIAFSNSDGTISVRATTHITYTTVADIDTEDADATDSSENSTDVYTFTTGSIPELISHVDATGSEQTVQESADALTEFSESLTTDDSALPADVPAAMSVDSNGALVDGDTTSTATQASTDATQISGSNISYTGEVAWAKKHVNDDEDTYWYGNDCTNFVSRSLYSGGGMAKKYGSYANRKKVDYWWHRSAASSPQTMFLRQTQSTSWSNALGFANFAYNYAVYDWHTTKSQVQVGDVVFYNWNIKGDDKPNGWSGISHASVVTKIGANHKIYISQHSPGHTKALTAQRTGKYKNMTVWIAKIYPNWY